MLNSVVAMTINTTEVAAVAVATVSRPRPIFTSNRKANGQKNATEDTEEQHLDVYQASILYGYFSTLGSLLGSFFYGAIPCGGPKQEPYFRELPMIWLLYQRSMRLLRET